MKKLLAVSIICSMCFLVSCGNILNIPNKKNSSLLLIENFLYVLSYDDVEAAKEFIHCNSPLREDRLDRFVAKAELINSIDFSKGIEIIDTTFDGFSLNEVIYKGDTYGFTFEVSVSDKIINMFFILVDNDQGHGIHSFSIIE